MDETEDEIIKRVGRKMFGDTVAFTPQVMELIRSLSRDRWAQSNGIDIFRFTGSELWRDPLGCAEQVMQWANRGV
jgi:hypothetical protein